MNRRGADYGSDILTARYTEQHQQEPSHLYVRSRSTMTVVWSWWQVFWTAISLEHEGKIQLEKEMAKRSCDKDPSLFYFMCVTVAEGGHKWTEYPL